MGNNKFFKGHNGLESIVEYKRRKRQGIKKIVAYVILGIGIYALVYTCEHREPRPIGEIYQNEK